MAVGDSRLDKIEPQIGVLSKANEIEKCFSKFMLGIYGMLAQRTGYTRLYINS